MATVTKRGDTYLITVSCGYNDRGQRVRQYMTWTPEPGMTARQIQKELDRQKTLFEEAVRSGQAVNKAIKFEPFAEQWLAQIKLEGTLKPATIEKYERMRRRVYSVFGHLKLCSITPLQAQKFINDLAEKGIDEKNGVGLSTKSQSLYLTFLSDVFNYAIRCGLRVNNPCRNVQTIKKEQKTRDCYTLDEAQELLEKLETAEPKYKTFFTLAIYTGFRRGELLGLEWKDIDFTTGVVTVNRISQYLNGAICTGTPKTAQSRRCLKLPQEIITLLSWYKAEQNKKRLLVGDRWQDTDRLFTKWDGSPMYPTTPAEWFKKFCAANGLRYVNVHSFRHLNASLLILNGVDVKTVSMALGHSQTSTTMNIYAHSFAEQQARASEAVAESLRTIRKNKA